MCQRYLTDMWRIFTRYPRDIQRIRKHAWGIFGRYAEEVLRIYIYICISIYVWDINCMDFRRCWNHILRVLREHPKDIWKIHERCQTYIWEIVARYVAVI